MSTPNKKKRNHAVSLFNLVLKHNFIKYLAVGIFITIFNIFFMWLLIDIVKMSTLFGSTIVVVTLFIVKFYGYVLIDLMVHSFKNFFKYASINFISLILNIAGVWVLIEVFHISTPIASAIVVYSLFILRFIMFKKTGLIKSPSPNNSSYLRENSELTNKNKGDKD